MVCIVECAYDSKSYLYNEGSTFGCFINKCNGIAWENEKIRHIRAQLDKLLLCDLSSSIIDSVKNGRVGGGEEGE